jgi:signal transduction histidine kinase
MTLRRKTFFIVTAALFLLLAILFFLSRFMLLNSYLQLEENTARRNTSRVLNTLAGELEQLSGTTADWAYWDDTYYFVQGIYDAYIANNTTDDTLISLDLNFMIFVDKEGTVLFTKFVDLENEAEIEPSFDPKEILSLLPLDETDLEAAIQTVWKTSGGPILVAARHILTSRQEGPIQGTLILGRFLNEAKVARLSQTLDTSLTLYPSIPASLPGDLSSILASSVLASSGILVQPVDRDTIAGYALISDVLNQPVLLLEVDTSREIYHQGLTTFAYYIFSLIAVGVSFIAVTLVLIDRTVLSRLKQLSQSVDAVRRTGDLALPIQTSGNDELSHLAAATRDMLAEIADSKQALEKVNLELEKRVRQRTQELEEANKVLLTEISERQQAQEMLADARDKALEALRLKTQILANISHDARTPLNIISLRAEMMLLGSYGEINARQKAFLETILLSTHELLQFVNNLLEEGQANASAIRVKNEAFQPGEMLQAVGAFMRPIAERKGLELKVETAQNGLPTSLRGDASLLKRVVNNLVDNAIKFTERGRVTVHTYQSDAQHWAIAVADTGSGIAEKDLPAVFDAFWQADGSMTRTVNRGVGLGLSIVKQLTLLMEGEVTVQSNPDGSTFVVTLPLRPVDDTRSS